MIKLWKVIIVPATAKVANQETAKNVLVPTAPAKVVRARSKSLKSNTNQ